MLKFIYILFFLFFFYPCLQAQNNNYLNEDSSLTSPGANASPDMDTLLTVNGISISPDSVENWRKFKAFEYAGYLDSLLREKQKREKTFVVNTDPAGPGWLDSFLSSPATKIFFWLLAALFILFILYKLFLTEGVFQKPSKTDQAAKPEVSEEGVTDETDLDAKIIMAVKNGNYRLAVRYHYIRTLFLLADQNLILLAVDKTNYEYVREIKDPQYRNDFARLTLSYEYVWYGEFAIDDMVYHKIESGFYTFQSKTKTGN